MLQGPVLELRNLYDKGWADPDVRQGLDSCATALCAYSAARLIAQSIAGGNKQVLQDLQAVTRKPGTWRPKDANEVTGEIFHTCFMGSTNSGKETRQRAHVLSKTIGSYHLNIEIDTVVSAITSLFSATFLGKRLRFGSEGGSGQEHLALQNIQSRSRMVLAYLFAGTLTMARGRAGNLLVLGSANVDEALRGYYTSKFNFKISCFLMFKLKDSALEVHWVLSSFYKSTTLQF